MVGFVVSVFLKLKLFLIESKWLALYPDRLGENVGFGSNVNTLAFFWIAFQQVKYHIMRLFLLVEYLLL